MLGTFRQPEVQHFHDAIGAHLDVGRLQIPMDDADLVRGLQRLRDLNGHANGVIERQRSAGQPAREVFALDHFHDQGGAGAAFIDAVNLRDVRMIERGQQHRFALKTCEAARIRCDPLRQDLDGHIAAQLLVPRAVDLAHPARAERLENLVVPDERSWPQHDDDACTGPR